MVKILLLSLSIALTLQTRAGIIKGLITNQKGEPLPYATVMIKGTTNGTTANATGAYQLDLPAGQYTVICQYMGYRKEEKAVQVTDGVQELSFSLEPVSMQIREVVVTSGGEDPAYAIIRQAIRKRSFYQQQVKEYTAEAYIKSLFKLRSTPKKVFGQKIDKKDIGVDSTGKGIIMLSESVTKISYRQPDTRLDVMSSRQSGGGLGFSIPTTMSFYDNNVEAVASQIGPRGFISPIAENALSYYRYKLEGSFMEDQRMVNKIKVIPRRKYEPLFAGYIYITDGDWRIHSTDLMLTQEYQLELADTLIIRQTHVPVNNEVWRTKDQVVYAAVKQFGFDLVGTFVNVYSNYNLQPVFPKGLFGKVVMKYQKDVNERDIKYWDSIRPVPLEKEEQRDFHVKDSTAKAMRDSSRMRYHLDSLRKKPQKVKLENILLNTWGHTWYFKRDTAIAAHSLSVRSLLSALSYNTIEGVAVNLRPSLTFSLPGGKRLTMSNVIRYGFSNTHLNAYTHFTFGGNRRGFGNSNVWTLAGGKRVSQFNKEEPIGPLTNSLYTLLLKENYMKLYENWFGNLGFHRQFPNTMRVSVNALYEDRIPLENTTDFVLFKNSKKTFLPNHPQELAALPFERERVLTASVSFSYQPGQKFIEYPKSRFAMGSKYPTFTAMYTKGFLDADFDKWKVSMRDDMNFKLFGELRYNLSAGGFLNNRSVSIPDLQHFNGNQTFYNIRYLNSFQLAPYYQYSTSANLYATANVEHHFNGLLTNKIPLFNRLKWNLVAGSNAFYVNRNNNYVEVFAGLENIFKMIRVDVVAGYQSQLPTRVGVRVGFGGILGGAFRVE